MNQRYDGPSEYGGSDGSNYIIPDGTPRSLSVGERARLLRQEGMCPGGLSTDASPRLPTDEPHEYGIRVQ